MLSNFCTHNEDNLLFLMLAIHLQYNCIILNQSLWLYKSYYGATHAVMYKYVPSLSMIVTVDDEVPSDNDKQLDNNLIATLNVSSSSCIISLMMSILNDDDDDPVEMVTLDTTAVDMA